MIVCVAAKQTPDVMQCALYVCSAGLYSLQSSQGRCIMQRCGLGAHFSLKMGTHKKYVPICLGREQIELTTVFVIRNYIQPRNCFEWILFCELILFWSRLLLCNLLVAKAMQTASNFPLSRELSRQKRLCQNSLTSRGCSKIERKQIQGFQYPRTYTRVFVLCVKFWDCFFFQWKVRNSSVKLIETLKVKCWAKL